MTTGRINQVAFLSDVDGRMIHPHPAGNATVHETPVEEDQDGHDSRSCQGTVRVVGRVEAETSRPRLTFHI